MRTYNPQASGPLSTIGVRIRQLLTDLGTTFDNASCREPFPKSVAIFMLSSFGFHSESGPRGSPTFSRFLDGFIHAIPDDRGAGAQKSGRRAPVACCALRAQLAFSAGPVDFFAKAGPIPPAPRPGARCAAPRRKQRIVPLPPPCPAGRNPPSWKNRCA